MSQNEQERWKPIDGYNGLYMVSDRGRIKSYREKKVPNNCYLTNGGKIIYEKILKSDTNHGYEQVGLTKNGKIKNYAIHRLVAQAFIPNPNQLPEINHKNHNKTDNSVDNLEWCDRSYNNKHRRKHKRIIQLTKKGAKIRIWDSVEEIENELGYKAKIIIRCCNKETYYAYSYSWRYYNMKQKTTFSVYSKITGEKIGIFDSITKAAKEINVSDSLIRDCLRGYLKSTHNFLIKRIEN